MAKHSRTPGERLIRIILKHRSNATARQIAWGGLRGGDLEDAKRQTKNLVVFEPTYRNGKQQASETARLTDRGVWEAIRLSEVYDPTLLAATLAAPGIEAYLTRLEKEKHPIAVKIAGYRKDAELWQNRQKRDVELERDQRETVKRVQALLNKIVDKIPSKICKRDIGTLNAFLEKKGRPRIEPEYIKPGDAAPRRHPARPPATPNTTPWRRWERQRVLSQLVASPRNWQRSKAANWQASASPAAVSPIFRIQRTSQTMRGLSSCFTRLITPASY